MNDASRSSHDDQRGAATLVITLILMLAMLLGALFATRNLLFEQRTSANQYRSTGALEAAEAGIEWALAQLNTNRRIGVDCEPSGDPAANSFRSRYLSIAPASGVLTPVTWKRAGSPVPLQPGCVQNGVGWTCSCPTQGVPSLPAPTGSAPAAAFALEFLPAAKPGIVRVVAHGCSNLAGLCLPGSTRRAGASARIEIALALVPGLHTAPAATVTTRAGFDAGNAAIGLHNPEPATGIAVDAGGAIVAPLARVTPPAGSPRSGALVGNDAVLAALPPERFFASYFGASPASWRMQPSVIHVRCTLDCATVLTSAIATAADAALIHLDGDITLSGPLTLGSAERPVALVVDGALRFDGPVALHGVVYAASLAWRQAAEGALVRGALLSEGGYAGDGAPALFHDRAVLDLLRHASGGFARVSGSWRDF